jgi:hypothetical protein
VDYSGVNGDWEQANDRGAYEGVAKTKSSGVVPFDSSTMNDASGKAAVPHNSSGGFPIPGITLIPDFQQAKCSIDFAASKN